jgi:Uma2 family endonuclease
MPTPATPPNMAAIGAEQRILLEGVSWRQYELLLATFGDDFPGLRLNYLAGSLEIMGTSAEHEEIKTIIAMLLESFFLENQIRFHGIGAATFRKIDQQRGLEPDECYCLGGKKELPDLAIEVVLSFGLLDKLEIYRGLGITEVWVWEAGQFKIYHLRNDEGNNSTSYELIAQSELLPTCDLAQLANYVKPAEQFDAVIAYREELRRQD